MPCTSPLSTWMFCPDNVEESHGLAGYAEQICGETSWTFWWD
jgi:hypothetical protein